MFEGLVHSLLMGYLGSYIKDMQKDQFRISVGKGEVLLEKAELATEAFDYLQLPFAVSKGLIGKLSIKIPWQKLGWDPILIVLEDVNICACSRDDSDWGAEAVDARALAGKRANLAAAELAKLSKRVSDSHAGQSFISYIAAKIIDNIQVTIQNVHIQYVNKLDDSRVLYTFGVTFFKLMVTTADVQSQLTSGSAAARQKGGQVTKLIEIQEIGLYWNSCKNSSSESASDNGQDKFLNGFYLDQKDYKCIMKPLNASVFLMVSKSGRYENGSPQYSVTAELNEMAFVLDENQIYQMIMLWDHINFTKLREKYGRFRPQGSALLDRTGIGWQKAWWHYALSAVLSDVKRRLHRTSWRSLGDRLNARRQYVRLYILKLEHLQQGKQFSGESLHKLEDMEIALEMDEILNYRSLAESKLQHVGSVLKRQEHDNFLDNMDSPIEKQPNEKESNKSRGWLNWLSLGMLGAGGTKDSSQFAGVISDEEIKDIYEATKYDPALVLDQGNSLKGCYDMVALSINVLEVTVSLINRSRDAVIMQMKIARASLRSDILHDSTNMSIILSSMEVVNPLVYPLRHSYVLCSKNNVNLGELVLQGASTVNGRDEFISIDIRTCQKNSDYDLEVCVEIQPFEFVYDDILVDNIFDVVNALTSYQSHQDLVLASLYGLQDEVRILSKLECVFFNRKRITFGVNIKNPVFIIPCTVQSRSWSKMVFSVDSIYFGSAFVAGTQLICHSLEHCKSNLQCKCRKHVLKEQYSLLKEFYDGFDLKLSAFLMTFEIPLLSSNAHFVKVPSASVLIERCVLQDEASLCQLKITGTVPSTGIRISLPILKAFKEISSSVQFKRNLTGQQHFYDDPKNSKESNLVFASYAQCKVMLELNTSSIEIPFEDTNERNEEKIILNAQVAKLFVEYNKGINEQTVRIGMESVHIDAHSLDQKTNLNILTAKDSTSVVSDSRDVTFDIVSSPGKSCKLTSEKLDCITMHLIKRIDQERQMIYLSLNNMECYCYPNVVGYLYRFYRTVSDESMALEKISLEDTLKSKAIETVQGENFAASSAEKNSYEAYKSNIEIKEMAPPNSDPIENGNDNIETLGYPKNEIEIKLHHTNIYFHDSVCAIFTAVVPKCILLLCLPIKDNSWEITGTSEGIRFQTSLLPPFYGEVFWRRVDTSLCPVLNMQFKQVLERKQPKLKIYASVQHVCCLLYRDLLAVLIGYFNSSHWSQYLYHVKDEKVQENLNSKGSDDQIQWKVEVTNSIVLLPIESSNYATFLELLCPHLLFHFSPTCNNSNAMEFVHGGNISEISSNFDIMYFSCKELSLSFGYTSRYNLALYNKFLECGDTDYWIFKLSNAKLSIQIRNDTEELLELTVSHMKIAFDTASINVNITDSFVSALESVMEVSSELSDIGSYTELFVTSANQFFVSKSELKKLKDLVFEVSGDSIIDVTCHVSKVCVKLHECRGVNIMDTIGVVDIQEMMLLGCWTNDLLQHLKVESLSLYLTSRIGSTILLKCESGQLSNQGISVHLSRLDVVDFEADIALPDVHFWMHVSAWNEFITLLSKVSSVSSGHPITVDQGQNYSGSCKIKSELLMIKIYFPEFITEGNGPVGESSGLNIVMKPDIKSEINDIDSYSDVCGRPFQKYLLFDICVYVDSLILTNQLLIFNIRMKQLKGKAKTINGRSFHCFPFSQITGIKVDGEIHDLPLKKPRYSISLHMDAIDFWISYPILQFLHNFNFGSQNEISSRSSDFSLSLDVDFQKAAFLLCDGRWSCNAPIIETFLRQASCKVNWSAESFTSSLSIEAQINYHNIHKVTWEPFMEPWSLQGDINRKFSLSKLLTSLPVTSINVESSTQLNLNITEAFVQAASRGYEMIKKILDGAQSANCAVNNEIEACQLLGSTDARRYAPYFLQNDTGMLLDAWLIHSPPTASGNILHGAVRSTAEPGHLIPLFMEETPEQLFQRRKPNHSSERLFDLKSLGTQHHMICIQFKGTAGPSVPMSMDLVGLRAFEIYFGNVNVVSQKHHDQNLSAGFSITDTKMLASAKSKMVPVIFEVSMQQYSKLVRLYSTVMLLNATSVSLEVRFDIHIGIDPKIMDPLLPGQELPVPLHLAESGQIRFRPCGSNYLWSEAQSLTNILYQDSKSGQSRSFVCYPSHLSSGPVRCYMSIKETAVPLMYGPKQCPFDFEGHGNSDETNVGNIPSKNSKFTLVRQIMLFAPLVFKNCLPLPVEISAENGAGIRVSALASEGNSVSIFEVDAAHDLVVDIHVCGFLPSIVKFSRLAVHDMVEKGNSEVEKLVVTESLFLYPKPEGKQASSVSVKVEKTMDATCGSRELSISVPFWLYNCTELSLSAIDGDLDQKPSERFLSSAYGDSDSYQSVKRTQLVGISSAISEIYPSDEKKISSKDLNFPMHLKIKNHLPCYKLIPGPKSRLQGYPKYQGFEPAGLASLDGARRLGKEEHEKSFSTVRDTYKNVSNSGFEQLTDIQACLHSPAHGLQHAPEATLRLRLSALAHENGTARHVWSDPFSLNPPNGSTTVVIHQPSSTGAIILSVTRAPVYGACSGKTTAVTFQPRYIISNACKRNICYRQTGTEAFYCLHVGEHLSLNWADVQRDFLVSIQFNEPGWDWSGSFHPDRLGDTLVKMRNYVSGSLQMVRVEVQNADESVGFVKHFEHSDGTLGTYLILLSDDDTGFMPYRIDNFSMQRLRFYQQKCEKFEHDIQPYTSCPYAWDEPCLPYQLVLEVPGEGVIGVYPLDEVKEFSGIQLPETSKKPGRKFHIAVHAEGPIKVISFKDASLHSGKSDKGLRKFRDNISEKDKFEDSQTVLIDKITISLPFVGLSVLNSVPQELAYLSAKGLKFEILQDTHQQKFVFQISCVQLDNQLPHAIYPVAILTENSLGHWLPFEWKQKFNGNDLAIERNKNDKHAICESSNDPAVYISAIKWKDMATSVECFEFITVSILPLRVEIEEDFLIRLADFLKTVTLRSMYRYVQTPSPDIINLNYGINKSNGFLPEHHFEFLRNPHSNQVCFIKVMKNPDNDKIWLACTSRLPVGAPWQKIYLLARKRRKLYIENFQIAPVKMTVSFSSTPWLSNDVCSNTKQSSIWIRSMTLQRGLMALVDVEGAPIYMRHLTFTHSLASWDNIQGMVIRHYTRQLLHEWYKVLGSVGMFGNPMGFARSLGFGIRDFVSVPAKSIIENPGGLVTSMLQGTKSLFTNTVFAVSNAATQFSKAAHKGVVAFAFDEEYIAEMGRRHQEQGSFNQGVLNAFLEGLTGLLQSPIKGVEKHGLPGIVSGVAIGTAGLIVKPAVSILDLAGRTAQSIRNRSNPRQQNTFRVRLPRPLAKDSTLVPYSWEVAVGTAVLQGVEGSKYKDEALVSCMGLKSGGDYVLVTKKLILKVRNTSMPTASLSQVASHGQANWNIEAEIVLDDIMHVETDGDRLKILTGYRQPQPTRYSYRRTSKQPNISKLLPITQETLDFADEGSARELATLVTHLIEERRSRRPHHIFHRQNLKSTDLSKS